MDCQEPVDDYCEVWQAENLKIPQKIPSTDSNLDQFFIVFEVETTVSSLNDEESKDNEFVKVEDTGSFTFWAPCPRHEYGNLARAKISGMLSSVGVPRHKQEFMVDKILNRTDKIANAAHNMGKRVLPVMVSISIVACMCCGESVDD